MALRTFTEDELKLILDKHKEWLIDYTKGEQANLSDANLSYANLSYANLSDANLSYANLRSANLSYANLSDANLSYANLSYANLSDANLSDANLRSANLSYANLSYANLSDANLRSANLSYANLSYANLSYADGSCPVKDIETASGIHGFKRYPTEGEFIAFKKVMDNYVLKVKIPADADRVNAYSSLKGRASKVITLSAFNRDGTEVTEVTQFIGQHDSKTIYAIGQETLPDSFNPSPLIECSHGIHFFLTFDEAKNW